MTSNSGTPAAGVEIAAPASHPFTCNSCQVAFRNNDLQKGHMKGDWHRYNLKRRVASLPPVSSEVFAEKVLQARATNTAEAGKAAFERVCTACQKTYFSDNSYKNHMLSQKHKANAALQATKEATAADDAASSVMSSTFSLGEPQRQIPDEGLDSDAEEEFTHVVEGLKKTNIDDRTSPVRRPSNPHLSAAGQHKADHPVSSSSGSEQQSLSGTPAPSKTGVPASSLKSCLFCNYMSPTVVLSVTHMERFHGLFIPEKQYLVDLEGLLEQLQKKVREAFECLVCGKVKGDVFAVQTHMRDTAHCKIPYTTEPEQLEIGDFYDFRATYSDDGSEDESMDDDDKQNGGAKLGEKRTAKDGAAEEDDGWETDSSASSLDSDDLHAVPADHHYHQYERLGRHPHHSQTDPRAHHQLDGWHSHAHKRLITAVFYDEYELHLPNGKSVGHRAHNRYYRQNLRHYPTAEEREERRQLAITEGDAMDVDDEAEAAPTGGVRDVAARARGRPEGSWVALKNSGQRQELRALKSQERTAAKLAVSRSNFKFGGVGGSSSGVMRNPRNIM